MGIGRSPIIIFPKNRICRAATTQVAYDNGYEKPLSYTQIPAWSDSVNKLIDGGSEGVRSLLSFNHIGSIEYVKEIETKHPGYLYSLYRYASKALGSKACFEALALCMNERSATSSEHKMSVYLGRKQLNN